MSNIIGQLQNLYTAKLAHYQAWQRDPSRQWGVPYPGFPGDREIAALNGEEEQPVTVASKPSITVAVRTAKTPKTMQVATKTPKAITKLDQAKAMFRANPDISRAAMIEMFITELGMTKAGATTYYYNAQK